MTPDSLDFLAVAPEVALTAGVVLLLLVEVNTKLGSRAWAVFATLGLAAATAMSIWQFVAYRAEDARTFYSDMIVMDGFGALAGMIVFPLAALALLGGWELVTSFGRRGAEFVSLVMIAAAGAHLMAASGNLIMLFIGLEVFSISLYILAGFTREREDADEAALKYFLLGAFASAVFLYGVALVFAATGSVSIYGRGGIADFLGSVILTRPGILLAGTALLLVGLAFKVGAAPFHAWAPDVYQGSPSGVTGFLNAGAKVAGFAALARVLAVALETEIADWAPALSVIAALSIVVGTLYAIAQDDIKRMLAYSSVAHAGFIATALVAGRAGIGDMWFYVATYAVQVIGAFTVVAAVTGQREGRAPLEAFSGLGKRAPVLAASLGLMMLAMGGIPLTAGFIGKAAVFQAALEAGYLWVVVLGLVAAVAGLFFYLRVVVIMYFQPAATGPGTDTARPSVGMGGRIVLFVASAATIVFGVAPWPLLDLVKDALPL
ncbi:MAG TPA: NADH-quinone oxidoreductase subunit N [Acidimicrobiia bacterium]|nr:NADH-quinone oxidoreductase subunit N [Acidimicrobiia bacterium]